MPVHNADVAAIFEEIADLLDLDRVLEAAAEKGCFVELNAQPRDEIAELFDR